MSTKPSSFLNMVVTLAGVTAVAAFALGFVYKATEEPIREAQIAKQMKAIKAVLGDYDNDPIMEEMAVFVEGKPDSLYFYPGRMEGTLTGMAIKTYSDLGYSGRVSLMVGFDSIGTIVQVAVLEHKETPGLGSKISDEGFYQQYMGQDPGSFDLRATKDGGNIDAISGATITTRAYSDAIQLAYDAYKSLEP
jgi:electron transport complex protein RnfG